MDGVRDAKTISNAFEALDVLLNRKAKMDKWLESLSPERRLCEENLMKQRRYAIIDETSGVALKTIQFACKRWERFEVLSRQDAEYKRILHKICQNEELKSDDETFNFLACLLIKGIEAPAEYTYVDGKMVAFSCPFCGEHTLLTFGTEYHHCTKCGQKIMAYNKQGLFGNVPLEHAQKCEEYIEHKKHKKLSDHYNIGQKYCLEIDMGKGENNETIRIIKNFILIGKYREYGLFECVDGSFRRAIRWYDIKEVQ